MNKKNLKVDKDAKRLMMQFLEQDAYLDVSEVIEYPPVAISCGYYNDTDHNGKTSILPIPIGTYGNFSFIHAESKVGKSFFTSLLTSAFQGGKNKYTGKIKGFRGGEYGKKIIHFDTEQSRFHCQKVFRRPLTMNGIDEDNEYYTYALRNMDAAERVDFIDYILTDKFNSEDIGLVIIDGIADLLYDFNNIEQSQAVIQKLMTWTDDLKCHIITVIHSNNGSDKPAGTLGSFLEKKTETQIKLEKNSINQGWVTVECKRGRNRNFETFSFSVDDKGLPEFIDNSFEF